MHKLFTLYTLLTDVNLFTRVIETLLTKFAIPHFDSITRRFTHHSPHKDMSKYENKQIPQKTGLASYLVSKSHGSEVRNCRDQRVFFRSIFTANNRKKTLWHPGYVNDANHTKGFIF